jgi:hypothetical protein
MAMVEKKTIHSRTLAELVARLYKRSDAENAAVAVGFRHGW